MKGKHNAPRHQTREAAWRVALSWSKLCSYDSSCHESHYQHKLQEWTVKCVLVLVSQKKQGQFVQGHAFQLPHNPLVSDIILEALVEGARGLRDFAKVRDLKGAVAVPIRYLEARRFLLRLLMPELLLLEDKLVLGGGVEKHPERSIGSGELQMDNSVEDIVAHSIHSREPAKIGKRGHFNSPVLVVMELIMNITKFSSPKMSDSLQVNQ